MLAADLKNYDALLDLLADLLIEDMRAEPGDPEMQKAQETTPGLNCSRSQRSNRTHNGGYCKRAAGARANSL